MRVRINNVYPYALYAISIALANLACSISGEWGAIVSIPCALFIIGMDLVVKDHIQDMHGIGWRLFFLIAGGGLASLIFTPSFAIARASFYAFTVSTIVDVVVFRILDHSARRYIVSNLFSVVVDSFLFMSLAFGRVTWLVAIQILAKLLGAFLWIKILRRLNVLPM